ncbi:gamma-glutamyltransferase, partial [Phenylobacterium sp.]|uniref:gamma-glutamyltransferase n=1 Tax=Phenylobacterium sp. TaxID=1871053 RepID=UPI0037C5A9FE
MPVKLTLKTSLAAFGLSLGLAACATAPSAAPTTAATPASTGMVAAANPLAVEAGLKVLRAGGNAVDAAVAVQAALGLVEPQSSGLGGGAFLTFYDARTKAVTAYNGRETAPKAATDKLFYDDAGKPLDRTTAVLSGRSTGVPGAVAMLKLAHDQHGKLAWKDLFGEAERMADEGFPAPRRMAMAAASRSPQAATPDAIAYFTKADGTKIQPGDIVRNPAYAATVRKIAAEGPRAILEGPIAEAIVAKLKEGAHPGAMTLADMKAYRAKASPALCRPYRIYVICVPPAPSGGPAVLQGLGLLERTAVAQNVNNVE